MTLGRKFSVGFAFFSAGAIAVLAVADFALGGAAIGALSTVCAATQVLIGCLQLGGK